MNKNVPTEDEVFKTLTELETTHGKAISTSHIEMVIARAHRWEYDNDGSYNDTTSIRQGAVYRILKKLEERGEASSSKHGLGRGKLFWQTANYLTEQSIRRNRTEELKTEAEAKFVVSASASGGHFVLALPEAVTVAEFKPLGTLVDTAAAAEDFAAKLRKNYVKAQEAVT